LVIIAWADLQVDKSGISLAQGDGDDWPMLAHDLARSSATPHQVDFPLIWPPTTPVWVRDFASGNEQDSELVFNQYQPVVVGSLVYVGTSRNNMYALDTESGAISWSYEGAQSGMIIASPAVDNGVLYYAATNGHVYALNATTGALLWDREIVSLGGFRASPAVYNGRIYLGAEDGLFYALDAADGSINWTYDTGAPILNTAAVDVMNDRIYLANEDMLAFALSINGDLIWQSAKMHGISTRRFYPVIADEGNTVIFRTAPGPAHRALTGGDTLMGRNAGLTVPDDFEHLNHGDEYGTNVHTSYDAAGFDAEQDAIEDWLINEYPAYETFYVFDASDGSKRYTVPLLWSGGSGEVGEPPVVAEDGAVYVRARSYYGNFDFENCVYHFGAPATLNLNTGRLDLFVLPEENNPYGSGIFMIGDEASAMSMGGNRLYFYSHGDVVGSVLTSGLDAEWVALSRDIPHTITNDERDPALPFGQDGLWHIRLKGGAGGGSSLFGQPAVIADGKAFFVSQGMIGMYKSGFNDETNYIADSRGTQPSTGPIAAPSVSVLESYVAEIDNYPVDPLAASDITNELEAHISDMVSGERYAPFIQLVGKSPGYIYYLDPTEEAYILAIAYPYLSSGLQQQVESHLDAMWSEISNPLQDNFSYNDLVGRRRERYEINNDAGEYAVSNGHIRTTASFERLYHLWAYAHYVDDWDFIIDHWDSIKDTARGIDPTDIESSHPSSIASVNRRVASLIGYARMADHLWMVYSGNPAYQSEYEWAINAAATGLRARLQWEEERRPTGTPWSHQWMQEDGGYDVFMDTGWGSGGHIPRYNGLTPAIAHVLRDYAWDDILLQNDFVDTIVPAQHLAWSFIPNRGEIFSNLLPQAREVFLAKSLIMQESPQVLRDYLSYPWCKGDLYYIERLVHILRNSTASSGKSVSASTASYDDILTYTVTLVGSGSPITLTDPVPTGVAYIPDSASREPGIGVLSADATGITWTGTLTENVALQVAFAVTVATSQSHAVVNQAQVEDGKTQYTFSTITIVNGFELYLPVILREYSHGS